MYFITLCGDTELRLKKIGRNSEGVLTYADDMQLQQGIEPLCHMPTVPANVNVNTG
jgi:hypothetical protein